ncbi:MAG: hypothetical protein R3197_17930 [Paracoccaceae bacterium]|nr:hypothetical protein [Paracoccaceae bacterium]
MPNFLAYALLGLWPLVSLALFFKFPPGRAIILNFLIAYLVLPPLPTEFDLPLVPPLNKETLPAVSALIICILMYGSQMTLFPITLLARIFLIFLVGTPVITALTNGDAVTFGRFFIQPLSLKEGITMMLGNALMVIPFILALNFLRTEKDQRDLLIALVVAGLVYSLPMLFEVRMSPQLNTWIYGFFQHSFVQMMRGDGFRPIVFLNHGLAVAFFCFTCILAAVTLFRHEKTQSRPALKFLGAAIYLFVVLILCKSLGSLLFALLAVPLVIFLKVRMQLVIAAFIAVVVMLYPVLKGNQLIPEREILAQVDSINPERAWSLRYRLVNEAILLDRAAYKPWFGWGTFGRSLIHDQDGQILTVPDGRWIVTLGTFGWIGFIGEFGTLGFPLLLLLFRIKSIQASKVSPIFGGLALLLAFNLIDLLPNSTLTPLTWITAGAVLGFSERLGITRLRSRPRWQAVM